ncbi:DNA mismatch repair protein MSH5 [Sporothrix schenckii 1099-18]|uniref:DNA mismatch repair protein MSH5 n=1 Tax=Sporothrix schenckii 1099-18 TaxID=1397361 RepID=A0A0F2LYT6_SPOSC|nr:DNA mismatch repair protein MSH5 [Sporothrix schenckii 1099-18]KJR82623.1 DNA mismatch repair protein MSH5 [Sporothrix schenckii 1099-18]
MVSNRSWARTPPVVPTRWQTTHRVRVPRFARSSRSIGPPGFSPAATRHDTAAHPDILNEILHTVGSSTLDDPSQLNGNIDSDTCPAAHDGPDAAGTWETEPGGVYMALEMKVNGTVGCAYYVSDTATVYLQDDTRVVGLELVESLLFQVRPTSIIVPSRAQGALVDLLDHLAGDNTDTGLGEDAERGFKLRSVVSSDFNPGLGRQLLAHLDDAKRFKAGSAHFTSAVEDVEGNDSRDAVPAHLRDGRNTRNKLIHLGTFINLDGQVSLGCASALIRDLERRQATTIGLHAKQIHIRSVLTVTYDDYMFVTAEALLSLQIFRPDLRYATRTGAAMSNNGSMAGTLRGKRSVFDMFCSLTITSQGRCTLREMFVHPSTDLALINARQQSISNLLDSKGQESVGVIRAALKKAKNILPILAHLRRGLYFSGHFSLIKESTWANLQDFCSAILQILLVGYKICTVFDKVRLGSERSLRIGRPALGEIDSEAIFQIQEKLATTIEFQKSRSCGRSVVARGVSPELDALGSTYSSLQVRLEEICQEHKARLRSSAQDDIVGWIFHPRKGYLLVASAIIRDHGDNSSDSKPALDDDLGFGSWEEILRDDGLLYFKTPSLCDVDKEFGDLAGRMLDLEVEVLHCLGSEILKREEALICASNAIGHIDSILALSNGAKSFQLVRPQMTEENVLYIRKGRQLWQETDRASFVVNDCQLSGGSGDPAEDMDCDCSPIQDTDNSTPSTVVLTGPNNSGKSVYLRQVATILFLAHVGSYVPAEEAVVGITDKILTRIVTRESVSRNESTFGVDLRQAAFSINAATRKSLILMDEFGKGTATVDGAALFDALLDHFLRIGQNEAPKVLAATHFHEIFKRRGFKQHPRLGLFYMSVAVRPIASKPEEKVKFLHILREGRSTESFGCHCAAISGVTPTVVERASQIATLLGQGGSLSKVSLLSQVEGFEKMKGNEYCARRFVVGMAKAVNSSTDLRAPRELLRYVLNGNM